MGKNIKIIELIGIPGSGKSFYLRDIKKSSEKVFLYRDLVTQFILEKFKFLFLIRILPKRIQNKLSYKLYTHLKYDLKFQEFFKTQNFELSSYIQNYNNNRTIREEHKYIINKWFDKTGEYYVLSRKVNSNGIFYIDEGFAQRVSSLFISEENEVVDHGAVIKYLDLIPRMSKIIFIERNLEECIKSRITNPGYRLKNLKSIQIESILKLNQYWLKFSFDYIRNNKCIPHSIVLQE